MCYNILSMFLPENPNRNINILLTKYDMATPVTSQNHYISSQKDICGFLLYRRFEDPLLYNIVQKISALNLLLFTTCNNCTGSMH